MLKSSEYSPIGYDVDEQAAVHDELREFLGSDDESESDADASEAESLLESRKRKRGDDTDTEDETASLAHRIKTSRPSTLKQTIGQDDDVVEADLPAGGSQEASEQAQAENPDDDEDELEREMLAAFEDGEYDE